MRFTLDIVNTKGLHARASAKFVEIVEAHDAAVTVRRDGMEVGGDSIMGLMMLGAAYGTTIDVEVTGAEEQALAAALKALVAGMFGEEM
jgi:phosphocarrier protein